MCRVTKRLLEVERKSYSGNGVSQIATPMTRHRRVRFSLNENGKFTNRTVHTTPRRRDACRTTRMESLGTSPGRSTRQAGSVETLGARDIYAIATNVHTLVVSPLAEILGEYRSADTHPLVRLETIVLVGLGGFLARTSGT
ncbi:hypothetical protein C8039_11810 [Halogeometricum sp. wsp3]|nr:hypothetical protein C8039_11810 [Halogeometricum sp. wsp3]